MMWHVQKNGKIVAPTGCVYCMIVVASQFSVFMFVVISAGLRFPRGSLVVLLLLLLCCYLLLMMMMMLASESPHPSQVLYRRYQVLLVLYRHGGHRFLVVAEGWGT